MDEQGQAGARSDLAATGRSATRGQVVALLQTGGAVLVLTHRNPDGDAIGSANALARGLRMQGADACVVCPDPLPEGLLGIPDADLVATAIPDRDWSLVISVDVSDPLLLRDLPASRPEFFARFRSLNIDHHVSNLHFARFNYVQSAAASAAEIIQDLLAALKVPLDRTLATQLLYGVVNDTHSFQNSNTTPRTLRLTADLLETGADLSGIVFNLLLARTPASARLWSAVLPTLRFHEQDHVAMLTVTDEGLEQAGAALTEADGLVEFLRNIRGVELAAVFKQTGAEAYRLSLRTTERIDATRIAAVYGGGGHRRAAGCDAVGPLAEIERRILAAYRQQLAEQ